MGETAGRIEQREPIGPRGGAVTNGRRLGAENLRERERARPPNDREILVGVDKGTPAPEPRSPHAVHHASPADWSSKSAGGAWCAASGVGGWFRGGFGCVASSSDEVPFGGVVDGENKKRPGSYSPPGLLGLRMGCVAYAVRNSTVPRPPRRETKESSQQQQLFAAKITATLMPEARVMSQYLSTSSTN